MVVVIRFQYIIFLTTPTKITINSRFKKEDTNFITENTGQIKGRFFISNINLIIQTIRK